jgi:hypothetical protein
MDQPESSRATTMVFGAIAAAAGAYFVLGGAGVVALPDSEGTPGWIGVLAGLTFLCGGLAVATQALGRADEQGELPAHAPAWMRLVQHLGALVIVGSLATIGTWVALAGAADRFSMSTSFTGRVDAGVGVMRAVFGLGALMTWLFFFALARRSLKLLRGDNARR